MEYNFSETINGIEFEFTANDSCFSPKSVDKGTLAMLSVCTVNDGDCIVDLGCGYGVVGIWAANFTDASNVYMLDINGEALQYAKRNADKNGFSDINVIESNGYENLDRAGIDIILSNPPYHTDFAVAKMFIEKGFNRLKIGGKLYMVTKRLDWYKNKIQSIFGGCKIHEIDGYYVFVSEKRSSTMARKSKKQR